jgi:hypothetical protein
MRQRLQEWLEAFAEAPLDELTRELVARGISPQRALDKREALQNLYRQMLASGRPVQIRTFHSWFAALLGTAPLALLQAQGLPANFELLEDDAEAVREVWGPFLQAVATSASLRADYEAVVARHGRRKRTRRWQRRCPSGWSLTWPMGRVWSMPRCRRSRCTARNWPLSTSPPTRCRMRRLPPALAGPRQGAGGRVQQDAAKGGRRHHRCAGLQRPEPAPRSVAQGHVRRQGRPPFQEPRKIPRRAGGRARAAAPAHRAPPARRLAAPAAHGPAGALPDCAVCRRQAPARLGGHERCGAHRAGHAG